MKECVHSQFIMETIRKEEQGRNDVAKNETETMERWCWGEFRCVERALVDYAWNFPYYAIPAISWLCSACSKQKPCYAHINVWPEYVFITSSIMAKVSHKGEEILTTLRSEVDISSQKVRLARKLKIEWPQCSGRTKKAEAPDVTDLKNVTPAQRIRQFPNECLVVLVIALLNNLVVLG